jgi:hypothetical protein
MRDNSVNIGRGIEGQLERQMSQKAKKLRREFLGAMMFLSDPPISK